MAAVTFVQVNNFRFLRPFQPDFRFGANGRGAVNDDISIVALQLADILAGRILAANAAGKEAVIVKDENA